MSLIQEIKEAEKHLRNLEKEYLRITPVCDNLKCGFYRPKQSGCCSWSVLLEDCRDYKPLESNDD